MNQHWIWPNFTYYLLDKKHLLTKTIYCNCFCLYHNEDVQEQKSIVTGSSERLNHSLQLLSLIICNAFSLKHLRWKNNNSKKGIHCYKGGSFLVWITYQTHILGYFLGELAYQVSIQYRGSNFHFCGGTRLNDQWIVSAAHCARNQ
jgi:hypothetical protein